MSGTKEPIDLLMAKGKKHLTKNEIKERKNTEIFVPFLDVTPPKYLNATQKKEFNDIAHKLLKIGIMTELDEDSLARYLISKRCYTKITKQLNTALNAKKMNLDDIETLTSLQDKFFKQCRSSAGDLGLSISSRCKLIMPPSKDPPKENKFAKFGGMSE